VRKKVTDLVVQRDGYDVKEDDIDDGHLLLVPVTVCYGKKSEESQSFGVPEKQLWVLNGSISMMDTSSWFP
jgi:hypothetical protein